MSHGNNLTNKKEWVTKFVKTPQVLLGCKRLTSSEKNIFSYLLNRVNPRFNGLVKISVRALAEDLGIAKSTAQRGLKNLKSLEMLDWETLEGVNYYSIMALPKWLKPLEVTTVPDKSEVEVTRDGKFEIKQIDEQSEIQPVEPEEIVDEKIADEQYDEEIMDELRKEEERIAAANEIIKQASDKIKSLKDKKREEALKKEREKLTQEVLPEKKKTKKPNDVFSVAAHYQACFKQYYRNLEYETGKTGVPLSGKEMGQIKKFVNHFGVDVTKRAIEVFFRDWSMYKQKYNIDSDYPTIGIIVSYGKSKIDDIIEKDDKQAEEFAKKHAYLDEFTLK